MKLLVGISGQRDSGKSTIARLLQAAISLKMNTTTAILGFSEPIYEIMKVFGFTQEQIDDKNYRNVPQPDFGGKTLIELMVLVGSDLGRDMIDKNIWINMLMTKALNSEIDVIIVENVRFQNERFSLQSICPNIVNIGVKTHLPLIDSKAEVEIPMLVKTSDIIIDNSNYPEHQLESFDTIIDNIVHKLNLQCQEL